MKTKVFEPGAICARLQPTWNRLDSLSTQDDRTDDLPRPPAQSTRVSFYSSECWPKARFDDCRRCMWHLEKVELANGRGHEQARGFGMSGKPAVDQGGDFFMNHEVQFGLVFVLSYPWGYEHGQAMPKRDSGVDSSQVKFCCDGERVLFCHPP